MKPVRIVFWLAALILGGAQTWFVRHRIFSDGISYLAIAQRYAAGDWRGALNAYWSPLYSWLIAAYLVAFRPPAYWQTASLHVINFAAFLLSCYAFERFVNELAALVPGRSTGLSPRTLTIATYVSILDAGLLMIGIGYVSPDMIALFLTGTSAWLTARIARGNARSIHFAALGGTLGFAYLDRTAFAPLSVIYLLAVANVVTRQRMRLLVCVLSFLAVSAPFVIALSLQRHGFTMGESGKLNYGWEVDGADRSTHWQGAPGDIGAPLHPTRLILKFPVPVYEFGEPVGGSYPPWYDPSYWYDGIRPRFEAAKQFKVFWLNSRALAFHLITTPVFIVLLLAILMTGLRGFRPLRWPPVYWALTIPAVAGVAMYCLVFIDKRYIAGFLVVLCTTALAGIQITATRFSRYADVTAQGLSILIFIAMVVWLWRPVATFVLDAVHGRESESNMSSILAQKFAALGVKPGDRIAYVGNGMEADWVRLLGAKIVAEVPIRYDRDPDFRNFVVENEKYSTEFFELDEASRQSVYAAFRRAGAVLAVANRVPADGKPLDWTRVLDPSGPAYPKSKAQLLLQSPAYYRWLIPHTP